MGTVMTHLTLTSLIITIAKEIHSFSSSFIRPCLHLQDAECHLADSTLASCRFQHSRQDWAEWWKAKKKWTSVVGVFLRAVIFVCGRATVISRGQVCVFSHRFGSFNSHCLSLGGVKERWRERLLGADGSRQRVQGLLSDREPLSSAYLKFSLCLITNHSPDSTRAKRREAEPPQPSSLPTPPLFCFSLSSSPSLPSHPTRGGVLAFKKANL